MPGLNVTFGMTELRRLLEADAEFVASMRTRDQEQALRARDPEAASPHDGAVWVGTPEHAEQVNRDNAEARERYRLEWGHYPN